MLLRRDETATVQIWTEVFAEEISTSACLREHVSRLRKGLARAGLRVRASPERTRTARGSTIRLTEIEAVGSGPRRQAGQYRVAVTADGRICYHIEGFAAVPASRQARREVKAAVSSFEVDRGTRRSSATPQTRAQILRAALPAEQARNHLVLLDLATALTALWPEEGQGWQLLGVANLLGNRSREALRAFDLALRSTSTGSGEEERLRRFALFTLVADANARLRQWPPAKNALEEARKIVPDHPGLFYAEACFQALRGEVDKAIDSLESAFRAWPARAAPPRIPVGLGSQVALARRDDRLRALRQEPRFEILLRRFEARARKAE
jgi:tetratricopeptide (TPR) repeat protein